MERRSFILVYLTAFFFWIFLLQILFISTGGQWFLPGKDGYTNIIQARSWFEEHPYSINKGDVPTTAAPDHFYPLFESLGFFLGFKSPESIVLFTYIFNFLLLCFSLYFLYRIGKEYGKDISFHLPMLTLLCFAIFINFFMNNDISLLFFSFYGALAFMKSPLFYLFLFLSGWSRPDGVFAAAFLFYLKWKEEKQFSIVAFLVFLSSFGQFLLNKLIGGTFITHGVRPQSLFKYMPFYCAVSEGILNFLENLRASFLGFYPLKYSFSRVGEPQIVQFPPLFLFLTLYGIYISRSTMALPFFFLLLLLFLGDSFTIFAGIHLNRHFLHLYPIIFLFGLLGIEGIKNRTLKRGIYLYLYIYSVLLMFMGINMSGEFWIEDREKYGEIISVLREKDKNDVILTYGLNLLKVYLPEHKITFMSPALNGITGRYVGVYNAPTELFEVLQEEMSRAKYYVTENFTEDSFFEKFKKDEIITAGIPIFPPVKIWEVDLSVLVEKLPFSFIDELDTGDPISEKKHSYVFYSTFRTQGPLQSGYAWGDTVFDGGRIIKGAEKFILKNPSGKPAVLIMRTGNLFEGLEYWKTEPRNVKRRFPFIDFQVEVNGKTVFEERNENPANFVHYEIPLPADSTYEIIVSGAFISFHYWLVIEK